MSRPELKPRVAPPEVALNADWRRFMLAISKLSDILSRSWRGPAGRTSAVVTHVHLLYRSAPSDSSANSIDTRCWARFRCAMSFPEKDPMGTIAGTKVPCAGEGDRHELDPGL